jgi:FAD/FMN-containing dehydrogenase
MAQAILDVEWVRDFDRAMSEYAGAGVYVNFTGDPSRSAVEAGFGPEKYARLVEIKRAYDPENVFRSNTNIPPDA